MKPNTDPNDVDDFLEFKKNLIDGNPDGKKNIEAEENKPKMVAAYQLNKIIETLTGEGAFDDRKYYFPLNNMRPGSETAYIKHIRNMSLIAATLLSMNHILRGLVESDKGSTERLYFLLRIFASHKKMHSKLQGPVLSGILESVSVSIKDILSGEDKVPTHKTKYTKLIRKVIEQHAQYLAIKGMAGLYQPIDMSIQTYMISKLVTLLGGKFKSSFSEENINFIAEENILLEKKIGLESLRKQIQDNFGAHMKNLGITLCEIVPTATHEQEDIKEIKNTC